MSFHRVMVQCCTCHLLLLLATVISQCGATEYYVRPTEPTNTSCPGQPCLTLNQYINNSSHYIQSNVVVTFLPGKHVLERPLEIRNVDNVTLRVISDASGKYPQLVAQFSCWSNYQCSNKNARVNALLNDIPLEDCSIIQLYNASHISISGIHVAIHSVNISAIRVEQSTNIHLQIDIYSVKTGLDTNGCNIGIVAYKTNHLYVDKLHARNLLYGLILRHIQSAQISKSVMEHSGLFVMKSDAVQITSTTSSGNKETGMELHFCNNTNMVNISAVNNDESGVFCALCMNTSVTNIYTVNNRYAGVVLVSCSNTSITNLSAMNNLLHGIYLKSCGDTSITNAAAINNQQIGIALESCNNTNTMNQYASSNEKVGIYLKLCTNASITNGFATNNSGSGLNFVSCRNVSITNIYAINNQNTGMALQSCRKASIDNVSAANNLLQGILFILCRDTRITNVSAINNQKVGMVLLSCINTNMMNLSATNNENAMYTFQCSEMDINYISATNNRGIGIVMESCRETKVTDISATKNQGSGIDLHFCTNTSISNILTSNNQRTGIGMLSCNNTNITELSTTKNQWGGLNLMSCKNIFVACAYAAQNHNGGIRVQNFSTDIAMRNVSVDSNRYAGIFLLSQSKLQLEESVFSDVVPLPSPSVPTKLQTVIQVIESTLIVTNCNFTGNRITSIRAFGSKIRVQGDILFAGNQALVGTALHFSQSSVLVISETGTIKFESNHAVNYGGAVYIDTEEMYGESVSIQNISTLAFTPYFTTSTECFIHVEGDRSQPRLIFVNNTAGRGGDVVYEGLVALGYDGDWNCLHSFKNVSDMSQQNNLSLISSAPSRVCLCQNDHFEHPNDCLTVADPHTYSVYPGQTITLPAVVVGQDFGSVTGPVIAEFLSKPLTTCFIKLEEGQQSTSVDKNNCTKLKYSLYTRDENCTAILALKTDNANVLQPMTIEDNYKLHQSWKILNENPNYRELASLFVSELYHNAYPSTNNKPIASNYSEISLHTIKNFLKFTLSISSPCTNITCIVYNFGKFVFPKEIYGYPTFINISFSSCPLGFSISTNPPFKCYCNHLLQLMPRVKCDIQQQRITRDGLVWIGTHSSGALAASKYCPYDYCKSTKISLTLQEPDSEHSNHSSTDTQCNYRHSGILCGGCQPGLSLALGSERCLHCSNVYISLLLPFAMAGVVLVFLIKFLNLTISQGTMNALIFYANVVSTNKYLYYDSTSINHTTLFIAWFNLDIGIETCFFNGLTAYIRTWLQFVFPLYIWTIAGLIIVLAKYNDRVAKVMGNNGVPVLATLFLLSYAKLFNTIIRVMSFTTLQTTQGQYFVWSVDGNIAYLGPEHAPLFAVAVTVLVFLWLPYTLLLLLGQWLHKLNFHLITRLLFKLKPFLDAHYAPFKDRHRYWFGLLLLARVAILLISAVIPHNTAGITEFSTALLCMVLTFWGQNVYRNSVLGNFATAFFLNLAIINVTTLFSSGNVSVASVTLIAIALAQFVGLVLYKIIARFKCIPKVSPCCVGQREAEDDWELYEQAALQRERESDIEEDRESDISGSIDSLPTY